MTVSYSVQNVLCALHYPQADRAVIANRINTPLGGMLALWTEKGLCCLDFLDTKCLQGDLRRYFTQVPTRILFQTYEKTQRLQMELDEYFLGKRGLFSIELDMRGTAFQQLVWKGLLTIPLGTTISYREQAEALGRVTAVRAVATANGRNQILILVPCHRVVSKDGTLGGYRGGVNRKQILLDLEQRYFKSE